MLGSLNPPETLISNQSSHHENSLKLSQNDESLIKAHQMAFQKMMISAKDQNTESRAFQFQNKSSFREKFNVLKKAKENFKKSLSNLDKTPSRIMRTCFSKYRGQGREKHSTEYKSEQQGSQFDSNEQDGDENYTGTHHLKEQDGLDQNSLYKLSGSKNKLLKKRTYRFHADAEILFPIPEGFKYHYSIIRKHEGTKYFYPEFQLVDQEKQVTIYCKKNSLFQFVFTLKHGEWTSNYQSYIGRLVSNITGSVLNLYIKITYKQKVGERVICSIEYTNNYLSFGKPRKIQVFMLNLMMANIEDQKYEIKSSLRQIYENDKNSNIVYLENKYPTVNKANKLYSLDFHGRAPVSSVKNFILEEPEFRGRQYLLFGKRQEDGYNLDFMHPFSSLGAFAVSVSNFNGKIICE